MMIEVTEQMIELAQSRGTDYIADAIKAAGAYTAVVSDLQTIRFTDSKGVRHIYPTPRKAQIAMITSDQGEVVEPFKFLLRGAVSR
jgi:hypothetical protein